MAGNPIRTARCLLTPWALEDAEELGALLRLPSVRKHLLDDQLVTAHWVEQQIDASTARFAGGGFGLWTMRLGTGDGPVAAARPVVGFAGFLPVYEPPVLELLYGLHPDHVGLGLATEAARAVIEVYLSESPEVVRASIDEPNQASARVLARLGFVEVRRDPASETLPVQIHFELPRSASPDTRTSRD